jgi:hypothetical protein
VARKERRVTGERQFKVDGLRLTVSERKNQEKKERRRLTAETRSTQRFAEEEGVGRE